MTLRLAPASLHRRLAGLLLCAMLLMQMVGLWHGVLHAQGPLHPMHDSVTTLPDPTGLERPFAHHDDAADCQVFDQLSHADALGFVRLDSGVEYAAVTPWRAPPLPDMAAQASGFQARGPPALA